MMLYDLYIGFVAKYPPDTGDDEQQRIMTVIPFTMPDDGMYPGTADDLLRYIRNTLGDTIYGYHSSFSSVQMVTYTLVPKDLPCGVYVKDLKVYSLRPYEHAIKTCHGFLDFAVQLSVRDELVNLAAKERLVRYDETYKAAILAHQKEREQYVKVVEHTTPPPPDHTASTYSTPSSEQ